MMSNLILLKNARFIIEDADTVLKNADLLIEGERIASIRRNLDVPDAKIIDASKKLSLRG